jgi:hypothetical protein
VYHQFKISEEDKKKTTFITEWGSFMYSLMPFVLKNSPTVFFRIVIETFRDFIHKFLEFYMDDWIVYSFLKEHVGILGLMFDRCSRITNISELEEVYFLHTT